MSHCPGPRSQEEGPWDRRGKEDLPQHWGSCGCFFPSQPPHSLARKASQPLFLKEDTNEVARRSRIQHSRQGSLVPKPLFSALHRLPEGGGRFRAPALPVRPPPPGWGWEVEGESFGITTFTCTQKSQILNSIYFLWFVAFVTNCMIVGSGSTRCTSASKMFIFAGRAQPSGRSARGLSEHAAAQLL